MATWTITLPDPKAVGDATHVEDHNVLVQAIAEARAALDALETAAGAPTAWADVTGKPATFPPAIGTTATTAKAGNYTPTVATVTGLQTALDSKADDSDLSAKADASALAALDARVATLEAAAV